MIFNTVPFSSFTENYVLVTDESEKFILEKYGLTKPEMSGSIFVAENNVYTVIFANLDDPGWVESLQDYFFGYRFDAVIAVKIGKNNSLYNSLMKLEEKFTVQNIPVQFSMYT